jgi:hypothetical protein
VKITITIEVGAKGSESFAQEIHSLLPTIEQLKDFRQRIIPAVLPVKFRIVDNQKQTAFIEFDD